jgi:hypothetical protein
MEQVPTVSTATRQPQCWITNGVQQQAKGAPEKQGMLVLEVFKGHFNTRNKNHI